MKLSEMENVTRVYDKKRIEYLQTLQRLVAQEHDVSMERMKELDFARLNNLGTLYNYKVADYDEQQQIAQDVKNEYLVGKADPKMAIAFERTAR